MDLRPNLKLIPTFSTKKVHANNFQAKSISKICKQFFCAKQVLPNSLLHHKKPYIGSMGICPLQITER